MSNSSTETEKTLKQQLKESSDTVNGAYDYWKPETEVIPAETALALFKEWLEQKQQKLIPWGSLENKSVVDYLESLIKELE